LYRRSVGAIERDVDGIGDEPMPAAATHVDPFRVAAKALDGAGVRWCRLRDRNGGAEDDILLDAADLSQARVALGHAGWREVRYLGHGSHRSFYMFDPEVGRWLKIDFVTALDFGRWQEWPSTLAAGCMARSTAGIEGRTLTPDDAFWALILHELLDRPGSAVRRGDRLRELAAGAYEDGPGAEAIRPWLPRGWAPATVIAAAAEGDIDRLAGLGQSLSSRLARRPTTMARRLMARGLRWLDHRDPPLLRRGLTVALLGPDGTGKTSLAQLIGRGGPMPIRSVYLGLYGGSRARMHGLPGLGLARRLTGMWRGWLIGWWHVRRGRLVLFDRHPYDARLGGPASSPLSHRLRRAVLGHALPPPDVVIVLDAPADLLFQRKPEHSVDRIEAQRRRYLALSKRLDRAHVIDASAPLDEVARRITAIVWRGHDGPTRVR
jgi:hypothetical protein